MIHIKRRKYRNFIPLLLIICLMSSCGKNEDPVESGRATATFIPYATPTDEPARPAQITGEFDLINCPMEEALEWLEKSYSLEDFEKSEVESDKWNYIYIFSKDTEKKISKYGVNWDWIRMDSNQNTNWNLKSLFFYIGTSMSDYNTEGDSLSFESIEGEEAIRIYNDLSAKLTSDYGEPVIVVEQNDLLTKTWYRNANVAAQLILAFGGDERESGTISLSYFKDTTAKGFTAPSAVTPSAVTPSIQDLIS